jgi:hypothetical protein
MIFGIALSAFSQSYFSDAGYRQTRIRDWREDFGKLEAQIPTLSPSEEKWLKVEFDDTIGAAGGKYTGRSLAAMDS